MTEFKYRAIYSPRLGRTIFKPYAKVLLSHGRRRIMCEMLIDSGADVSLLSKSLGEALGLRLKRGEKIVSLRGLGGEIPIVYRVLLMEIARVRFSANIAWALVEAVPVILGRQDVFDEFHIEFRQDEKIVRFEAV